MKKLFSTLLLALFLILPAAAHAQLTVPQGGTGYNAIQSGSLIFGGTSLRVATSSALQFNAAAARLTVTNASTTVISADTICLTADTCETAWPSGSGSPGGLDTYVQFNDGGSFGGDSAFIWNKTADRLTWTYGSSTAQTITSIFTTNFTIGGDTFDELVGTGLTISSGDLQTTLGVAIDSSEITNGTIVVADLSSADFGDFTCNGSTCTIDSGVVAAADLATADFGDFSCSAGTCTVDANSIALTTDTTGNYVATVADAGSSRLTVSGSGSEGAAVTVDLNLTTANTWTGKQTFGNAQATNATTSAMDITSLLTFGGVTGNSWDDFCTALTGGSGLCDGVDNTGGGGSGLATSTPIADTYVIYGTSAADVGAEAAFNYDDATNRLTVDYASTTAVSATSLCLSTDCRTSWPTGGGSGNVATSTSETAGQLAYWTSTAATPATLGKVATSSVTINAPLTSAGTPGFVVGGSGWTLDVDDIAAADLANADFGDFSCNGTTCTTDNGSIGIADLASVDFGSFTCNGSSCTIDSGAVTAAMLATADFGDFSCSGGSCTVDANSIALTTDTTGNYLATLADDGQSTITVNNSGSEGAAVTLRVIDVVCTDCLTTTEIADSYLLNNGDTATGDYTFDTTTLFIDSTNDKVGIGTTTPFARLSVQGIAGSAAPIFNVASSSLASFFSIGPTGTTTISGATAATSSAYIYSTAAGKGGAIILEDSDGAGCTEVSALNGVLSAITVTCPTEI